MYASECVSHLRENLGHHGTNWGPFTHALGASAVPPEGSPQDDGWPHGDTPVSFSLKLMVSTRTKSCQSICAYSTVRGGVKDGDEGWVIVMNEVGDGDDDEGWVMMMRGG